MKCVGKPRAAQQYAAASSSFRDLARHPRTQPPWGTFGLGWGWVSPCPSSWMGRGEWLGTFWTQGLVPCCAGVSNEPA